MFHRSPTIAQNIAVYRSECYSFVKIFMVKRDSISYRPRALHAFIRICTLLLHDSFLALYDAFKSSIHHVPPNYEASPGTPRRPILALSSHRYMK